MDVIANDAFRQFFSHGRVRADAAGVLPRFFMDIALLPPERRSHRLWLVGRSAGVVAGLALFFASTSQTWKSYTPGIVHVRRVLRRAGARRRVYLYGNLNDVYDAGPDVLLRRLQDDGVGDVLLLNGP